MEGLRWILLGVGVLLVVAIYLYGRARMPRRESLLDAARHIRFGKRAAPPPRAGNAAPQPSPPDDLNEQLAQLNSLLSDSASGRAPAPASSRSRGDAARRGQSSRDEGDERRLRSNEEKVVAVHIAAPGGETFSGTDLLHAFDGRGYIFGEYDIFHSVHDGRTVFSVVNMVKPGWFDPESMDVFTTPGISLFLRLPGPLAANISLDILFAEADALASVLNGHLQDATHSTLTHQTRQSMREDVAAFMHRTRADDPD